MNRFVTIKIFARTELRVGNVINDCRFVTIKIFARTELICMKTIRINSFCYHKDFC